MSNIITIGFTTEGATDKRFLDTIIRKTFEQIAFECESMIEVYNPVYIPFNKKDGFVKDLQKVAIKAFETGISILCVHVDADEENDNNVFINKIKPAFSTIEDCNDNICKNTVAIIPVRMSEAWILADKELFKNEIGTDLSDENLGINKPPESFADPKTTIQEALRIAQENFPQRRRKTKINEIYQPIGQRIAISELEKLSSFRKFKSAVRGSFIRMNYIIA